MEIQIAAAVSYGPTTPSRGPRDIPSHYLMPENPIISSVQVWSDLPASWAYKGQDLATRLKGREFPPSPPALLILLIYSLQLLFQ